MSTPEPEVPPALTRREARERARGTSGSAVSGGSPSAIPVPVTPAAALVEPAGPTEPPEAAALAEPAEPTDSAEPTEPVAPRRRRGARWAAGLLIKLVSWLVLLAAAILIIGFVLVPRLTGSTPYTVLTGSMSPLMPPGTTVVVKPLPFDQIRVGDVITYQLNSGEPEVVTHRVVGIDITAEGPRLEMKGDANPGPDPTTVRAEQVKGKVWYWLPVVGYFSSSITNDTRGTLAKVLGFGLIGYAAISVIVIAARAPGKRRRAQEAASVAATSDAATADALPEPNVPDSARS